MKVDLTLSWILIKVKLTIGCIINESRATISDCPYMVTCTLSGGQMLNQFCENKALCSSWPLTGFSWEWCPDLQPWWLTSKVPTTQGQVRDSHRSSRQSSRCVLHGSSYISTGSPKMPVADNISCKSFRLIQIKLVTITEVLFGIKLD